LFFFGRPSQLDQKKGPQVAAEHIFELAIAAGVQRPLLDQVQHKSAGREQLNAQLEQL
jgi:hypothetical protein